EQRIAAAQVTLCSPNPQILLRAAQAEGFTQVRLASRHASDLGAPLELENRKGERLAVQLAGNAATLVSTHGQAPIHSVVRRCTLENVRRHLDIFAGGQVVSQILPNGEIELRAVEAKKKA